MKNLRNIMVLCLVVFMSVTQVNACWIGYTIEELYNHADIIVIGEYKGEYTSLNKSFPTTSWEIHPEFVIKGDVEGMLNVETPGSSISKLKSSIDYSLADFGNRYFLLFLNVSNDKIQPVSPQGVFALNEEDEGVLFDKYNISNCSYSISEQLELLDLINQSDVSLLEVEPEEVPIREENMIVKASSFAAVVIGVGALLINVRKRMIK